MPLYYVTVKDMSLKRFIVDAESEEDARGIIEEDESAATFDRYLDGSTWEITDVSAVDPA